MCDKICANETNLKCYVNTVHLKLKPCCCEKCGKSFVQKKICNMQLGMHESKNKIGSIGCE